MDKTYIYALHNSIDNAIFYIHNCTDIGNILRKTILSIRSKVINIETKGLNRKELLIFNLNYKVSISVLEIIETCSQGQFLHQREMYWINLFFGYKTHNNLNTSYARKINKKVTVKSNKPISELNKYFGESINLILESKKFTTEQKKEKVKVRSKLLIESGLKLHLFKKYYKSKYGRTLEI